MSSLQKIPAPVPLPNFDSSMKMSMPLCPWYTPPFHCALSGISMLKPVRNIANHKLWLLRKSILPIRKDDVQNSGVTLRALFSVALFPQTYDNSHRTLLDIQIKRSQIEHSVKSSLQLYSRRQSAEHYLRLSSVENSYLRDEQVQYFISLL